MLRLALLPTSISPDPFFLLAHNDIASAQHWHLSSTRFGSRSSSAFLLKLMVPKPLLGPGLKLSSCLAVPGSGMLSSSSPLFLPLLPLAWPHSLPWVSRLAPESSVRKHERNTSGTIPALHG